MWYKCMCRIGDALCHSSVPSGTVIDLRITAILKLAYEESCSTYRVLWFLSIPVYSYNRNINSNAFETTSLLNCCYLVLTWTLPEQEFLFINTLKDFVPWKGEGGSASRLWSCLTTGYSGVSLQAWIWWLSENTAWFNVACVPHQECGVV